MNDDPHSPTPERVAEIRERIIFSSDADHHVLMAEVDRLRAELVAAQKQIDDACTAMRGHDDAEKCEADNCGCMAADLAECVGHTIATADAVTHMCVAAKSELARRREAWKVIEPIIDGPPRVITEAERAAWYVAVAVLNGVEGCA